MSKYKDLIRAAKEDEGQKQDNQENQKARKPEPKKAKVEKPPVVIEEQVNLGVKVPLSWRRHWAAESKRAGVSMTEVIVEALTKKFGKPE